MVSLCTIKTCSKKNKIVKILVTNSKKPQIIRVAITVLAKHKKEVLLLFRPHLNDIKQHFSYVLGDEHIYKLLQDKSGCVFAACQL